MTMPDLSPRRGSAARISLQLFALSSAILFQMLLVKPLSASEQNSNQTPVTVTAYALKNHKQLALILAYARYRDAMKYVDFQLELKNRVSEIGIATYNNPNAIAIIPIIDSIELMVNTSALAIVNFAYSGPITAVLASDNQDTDIDKLNLTEALLLKLESPVYTGTKGAILNDKSHTVESLWTSRMITDRYGLNKINWPVRLLRVDGTQIERQLIEFDNQNVILYVGPYWLQTNYDDMQAVFVSEKMPDELGLYRDVMISSLEGNEINAGAVKEILSFIELSATDIATAATEGGLAFDVLLNDLQSVIPDLQSDNLKGLITLPHMISSGLTFEDIVHAYTPQDIALKDITAIYQDTDKQGHFLPQLMLDTQLITDWISVENLN
jgi:hypothetical protein